MIRVFAGLGVLGLLVLGVGAVLAYGQGRWLDGYLQANSDHLGIVRSRGGL